MKRKQSDTEKEIVFESEIEERAFKRAMEAYNEEGGGTPYKEFFRELDEEDRIYSKNHNIKIRRKRKHY